jgi:hypothetical protein
VTQHQERIDEVNVFLRAAARRSGPVDRPHAAHDTWRLIRSELGLGSGGRRRGDGFCTRAGYGALRVAILNGTEKASTPGGSAA